MFAVRGGGAERAERAVRGCERTGCMREGRRGGLTSAVRRRAAACAASADVHGAQRRRTERDVRVRAASAELDGAQLRHGECDGAVLAEPVGDNGARCRRGVCGVAVRAADGDCGLGLGCVGRTLSGPCSRGGRWPPSRCPAVCSCGVQVASVQGDAGVCAESECRFCNVRVLLVVTGCSGHVECAVDVTIRPEPVS